ncbi:hypothetical protein [Martelella soudanensis]|uniref:hypothetical protein n=1 Tax=unclassified Martelella TaxID=2629616 RepID=UPI0015DDAF66|nr:MULTISPECIES: hypothetical protein [unclassified Martelella]
MNKFAVAAALASILAAPAAFAIQPSAIPDAGPLVNSPVGSTVQIESTGKFGARYDNYFRVGANGELEFVDQFRQSDN